jgi:poly(3-hydroxybutyrate) depolymerase
VDVGLDDPNEFDAPGSGGGGNSSPGCGTTPVQLTNQFIQYQIETSGTKAADATGDPGPWNFTREYYVWLPPGYDNTHPYPVVIQGPGCGGNGTTVYSLTQGTPGVDGQVIRVGLTPPPNAINHATAPNAGCFDDVEGDDSVEWPFYEGVMDVVRNSFCVDNDLVFASGNSTGSAIANQLGCKYAGDANYPVRGVLANTGGLSTTAAHVPTCSSAPMAGMWVHEVGDAVNPFAGTKTAVARAMAVNGCTIGTDYDTASLVDYPIGGGNPDTTCQQIEGCPADQPLVVCALPGSGHGSHDSVVNPGSRPS